MEKYDETAEFLKRKSPTLMCRAPSLVFPIFWMGEDRFYSTTLLLFSM